MQSSNNRSTSTDPEAPLANSGMPASLALLPASVVAFGGTGEPAERLMGLQSAVARAVQLLASIGQLRHWLSHPGLGRFAIGRRQAIGWHR